MERRFLFKNFIPSTSTRDYCSRKFHKIFGESPSGSKVSAKVVKDNDSLYHTSIEITAVCGKYWAQAADAAVLTSVKKATDKLSELMTDWRSRRFLDDTA